MNSLILSTATRILMPLDCTNRSVGSLGWAAAVATDAAADVVEAGSGVGLEHAAANEATAAAVARTRPDVLAWSTTASLC